MIGKSNQETFNKQIQTPMDIEVEIQIQVQTCTDWMVNFENRTQKSSPVTAFCKCKGCQQFPNDLSSFHGLHCAFAFFWCCVSLSSGAIEVQIQTQMQSRNTNMKGVNISTQKKYKCNAQMHFAAPPSPKSWGARAPFSNCQRLKQCAPDDDFLQFFYSIFATFATVKV